MTSHRGELLKADVSSVGPSSEHWGPVIDIHNSDFCILPWRLSLDVEGLFINIPLIEYIDLAVDYIIKGNPDIKLGRENLTKLFFFANAKMQ